MDEGDCLEGYFCPAAVGNNKGNAQASNRTNYCTEAQYCETGVAAAVDCPAGTFQFNKVQPDCLNCPEGYYCPDPVSQIHPGNFDDFLCPEGHWCGLNTETATANPCPPGTYNPIKGARNKSYCLPAPPGYYIADAGQSLETSLQLCTAGYFCMLGSYRADPDGSTRATW